MCNPGLFFLACERFRLFREEFLPFSVSQHVHIVVADINVDGIVSVCTADFLHERQVHHLRMLAQPPDVGLVARQTRTVDTALLSGSDADGLSVLHVTYGVTLRVLQGDEGDHQIAFGLVGKRLAGRGDVFEQSRVVQFDFIASLLECDAEHLFAFYRFGNIVGVYLDDVVSTFAFLTQDLERLLRVVRSNHPVADFTFDEGGGGGIASVAQCDEVAVARHTVGTSCTGVCTGDGGERNLHVVHKVYFFQRVAQREADGSPGGRHVFERCGGRHAGGFFQFLDQLPTVEGIQEVDVPRTAVEHFNRQFAFGHINTRGFLIRIASVL